MGAISRGGLDSLSESESEIIAFKGTLRLSKVPFEGYFLLSIAFFFSPIAMLIFDLAVVFETVGLLSAGFLALNFFFRISSRS
jgi:hypothetical protein